MVRRIVWTNRALNDRKNILNYWNKHNKSKSYSHKLNQLIKEAVKLIQNHPNIGRSTDIKNVRVKVIRNYLIFYENLKEELIILTFWDARNDPDKLNIKKQKRSK
jgi:addiction module RelE/StbE family toxin